MSKKFDHKRLERYPLGAYDRFFCLKPSWLLLATMLFLCRDFVLSILSAATAFGGGGSNKVSELLSIDRHWTRFAAEVPVLILAFAFAARVPTANAAIRWIWKHGSLLFALSVITQLFLLIRSDDLGMSLVDISFSSASTIALYVGILAYIFFSRRVKDTFADFPAREETGKTKVSSQPRSLG